VDYFHVQFYSPFNCSELFCENSSWLRYALDMDDYDELEDFDDVLDDNPNRTPQDGPLPATLVALCVLTFIGSAFILFKDFITYRILEGDADFEAVYAVEVLACLGSITAGIFMLLRKLVGFYIYLGSNILYFAAVLWYWLGIMNFQINAWTMMLIFVYVAAPIGFIIMYSYHKKYLH